ncbi:MAG: 5-bromo-4-chloroindolyl phosphate hydrolysis family protein [Oscillospiraceae bacterium]|jgi:hypothetical protein|nr:5-bromo-4-chloroindolyl phosphate hydrolysis family protein [Oscillospiraceae bacterium]
MEQLEKSNKKKKVLRKPTALPIYITGAVWLIQCLSASLIGPWDILRLVLITGGTFFLSSKVFRGKKYTKAELEAMEAQQLAAEKQKQIAETVTNSGTGDPELDALLDEGKLAISEMGNLRRSITNREVEVKILKIEDISRRILDNAIDDRRDVPRTRKFLKYYLPTTLKLLYAYDRMSEQDITGENVGGTIKRIEDMLDDIIIAYNKQLDAMFSDEALDIETDIRVMEAMMNKEGLK